MKKLILTIIILIVLVVSVLLIYLKINKSINSEQLNLHFLDVGQGDSILIISPDNKILLVDGGKDEKAVLEIQNNLSIFNKRIDYIIATHADSDHIGGLDEVIDAYEVGKFMMPQTSKTTETLKKLLNKVAGNNIETTYITDNSDFYLGCCVKIDFLWPITNSVLIDSKNENSLSASFTLSYKDFQAYFDGDLPLNIEDYIIKNDPIDVDLLKVAHHGSKTSTSQEFINILKPELSIISVGKNNSYHHPDSSIINRLKYSQSIVLRTDENGGIDIQTDGLTINY
jgi:competence protein ComEC